MPPVHKILWLRDFRPDVFARMAKYVSFQDFVVWRLTGHPVMDYSIASRTMLFDASRKVWIDEILRGMGIDESYLSPACLGTQPAGASAAGGRAKDGPGPRDAAGAGRARPVLRGAGGGRGARGRRQRRHRLVRGHRHGQPQALHLASPAGARDGQPVPRHRRHLPAAGLPQRRRQPGALVPRPVGRLGAGAGAPCRAGTPTS